MKTTFDITGMTCAACSARVQSAVETLDGAENVQVNLLTNSMAVDYDERKLTASDIILKVKAAGYGAAIHDPSKRRAPAQEKLETAKKRRLIVSVLLLLPLMYLSMGHMLSLPQPPFLAGHENAPYHALVLLALTLVILVINRSYFISGFRALLRRAPNMDSLIALGAAASFGYGAVVTVQLFRAVAAGDMETAAALHQNLYFESAAMIVTLVDIGKYIEERSKGKTKRALDLLGELAPQTAQVIRGGAETTVAAEELQTGDEIVVRPGTKIPADGVIVSGSGWLDQSALTGESMPVEKGEGDSVLCASLNTAGAFHFRAERVGDATTLSQMIALSLEAAASKAPISRLADRVSRIFVPVVIAIAALVFAIWMVVTRDVGTALNYAISVLVISCPCALGLATPVAIMVGTGQAAKNGLLFKSAAAMEQLAAVDTVVFDKTGTLTEGLPAVTDLIVTGDSDETAILTAAAALEAQSEHPIAAAVLRKAAGLTLPKPERFESFAGSGIAGTVKGSRYVIGNRKLLEQSGVDCAAQTATLDLLAGEGKTPLLLAKDGVLAADFAVADTDKPHAAAVVRALREQDIESVMLTGDNARTADAVAKRLGIARVVADVLPQNKDAAVQQLRDNGKTVAMVGDGVNDAPALSRADVGVAIGSGTDIAIESADLVLLGHDIFSVETAIRLCKAVIRNIRMNLFWAFFYNVIAIPLAAGAFYAILGIRLTPMIGAAAMSFSSVTVVLNALRLRRFSAESPATDDTTEPTKEDEDMKQIIEVTGMHCGHCAAAVSQALAAIPNVKKAKADHEQNRAVITVSAEVPADAIKQAVEKAGFTCGAIETKKGLF